MRDPKSYITLSDDPVSRANAFLAEVSVTHYQDWIQEDLKALLSAYQNFCHFPDAERVAALAKAFTLGPRSASSARASHMGSLPNAK